LNDIERGGFLALAWHRDEAKKLASGQDSCK
jgi:hypothetical protein